MTPAQRCMCRTVLGHMHRFYADPENVRRLEEWKRGRQQAGKLSGAPAAESRQGRHDANLTASASSTCSSSS
ncbi:hypothetical protein D1643_02970 [Enterorhabdus sp. P55]|nr:hypothetical protein [Enterorhabdus sp. P55]